MHFLKKIPLILLVVFITTSVQAQKTSANPKELASEASSVNDQFEFVIEASNRYRDERGRLYKVVRREWLNTLRSNTLDSIKAIQDKYSQAQNTITTQQTEIDDLKKGLADTQNTLDSTNEEKDSMALFGMQMSKTSYNILLWSIIAGLFTLLLVFIFKFRSSNSVTRAAKKSLAETEQEFEEHRRVALEREQKVRRELQDEINKQKGSL
ncbi:MAG: tRNA (guanine-N1)-methyltransferase [Bacteroidia bacterium]|nr:tRNA (guanine-N1)-methyltransferase [Bacteroidia bacterium]NND26309.1 tRNA (guanine-N1)-methyltransferase [Flavobacteriaceae bacterium]MBT8278066.1 tRNA (guanine-N1)-methyltransferase [Bacteroidia bacterium]NNK59578.1 tRNA (guanine-N1)-methyltransferase [Flavobacteriaceae bacterium]NNL33897.1 tRNA (guanine-N1)-methyltransferase [Flavobacteriaceae bacterium]